MGPIKTFVAVIAVLSFSCPPKASTAVVIESVGAFAYVHDAGASTLEIAYLETVDNTSICTHKVTKDTVTLFVESGTIVAPPSPPPNKTFDLSGALVSFPDLESSSGTLDAVRPTTGPMCQTWSDLSCVASVSSRFPGSPLDPNWKQSVNAAVRLTRGKVEAGKPTDITLEGSSFDFKPLLGTSATFAQRMTDRILIRAAIPSRQVVIRLDDFKTGDARATIIVEPKANRPVKLRLTASHSHNVDPDLSPGEPIEHFCAFYALRSSTPVPSSQLIPHLAQANFGGAFGAGQPFPGPHCPPTWEP